MASGPITSWQTDVEKVEIMTDFIFLGFKITADSDCSHEITSVQLRLIHVDASDRKQQNSVKQLSFN